MKRSLLAALLALATVPAYAQNIDTVAGNGNAVNSGDGGPTLAAEVYFPFSLARMPGGGY